MGILSPTPSVRRIHRIIGGRWILRTTIELPDSVYRKAEEFARPSPVRDDRVYVPRGAQDASPGNRIWNFVGNTAVRKRTSDAQMDSVLAEPGDRAPAYVDSG